MHTSTRPDGDWRPAHISDYHWISSQGQIWNARLGRLLKQWLDGRGGYYMINFKGKPWAVHRLVAFAFHGTPSAGQEVRHLNGCSTDNRASNLAWGTHTENVHDILFHGRNVNANKTHCPQGHPYDIANTRIEWVNNHARRFCRECERQRSARRYAAGTSYRQTHARR
jgi:hypothetical protein